MPVRSAFAGPGARALPAARGVGVGGGLTTAQYHSNMKTIAVTIDPDTLASLDHLLSAPSGPWKSRSPLVRQALQEFVREAERQREEAHEAAVFREHRERLAAEARALIAEQAEGKGPPRRAAGP